MKRLDRIKRAVDAIELGRYSEFTLSQCADYIAWVAKFHKAPESEWLPICEKITQLFDQVDSI